MRVQIRRIAGSDPHPMKLEDLQPNTTLRGILTDSLVTVVSVQWFGSAALELTYKTPTGDLANELLYRHDEPRLDIVELGRPCSKQPAPATGFWRPLSSSPALTSSRATRTYRRGTPTAWSSGSAAFTALARPKCATSGTSWRTRHGRGTSIGSFWRSWCRRGRPWAARSSTCSGNWSSRGGRCGNCCSTPSATVTSPRCAKKDDTLNGARN